MTKSEATSQHVPERTCAACRTKRPQGELVRLSKQESGWVIQTGRQRTGRGIYLCADKPECWNEKKLRRSFGAQAPQLAGQLLSHQNNKSNMGQPMND